MDATRAEANMTRFHGHAPQGKCLLAHVPHPFGPDVALFTHRRLRSATVIFLALKIAAVQVTLLRDILGTCRCHWPA